MSKYFHELIGRETVDIESLGCLSAPRCVGANARGLSVNPAADFEKKEEENERKNIRRIFLNLENIKCQIF